MSNFSDFIKNNDSQVDDKQSAKSTKKYSNEELQSMIDKYSSYSEDKLLGEFMKLTLEKKRRGELKDKEFESMKSTILPFLNDSQKSKLNELLEMVRNVK